MATSLPAFQAAAAAHFASVNQASMGGWPTAINFPAGMPGLYNQAAPMHQSKYSCFFYEGISLRSCRIRG